MKKCLLLFLCLIIISGMSYGQRNCGSMDHLHQEMQQDPKRGIMLEQIEQHTREWIANHRDQSTRNVITIPVVVHVVYRTSTENISTAQIQSQIDVLNDDFRRLNSDADNTWSQAADTEIEFCLATIDPQGNATSGITRTSTTVNGFGTNNSVKFNSSGGKDAWPASDYLNIWVCNIGGGILGYAQFPGGSASTDGVVNDYRYFGTTGTATAPFDLGRTCTHEVGHYLNLRHIWGDGPCSADDFVSDTPSSDAPNYGCSVGHVSCNSTDMVQNYMDYSDDGCMNLFTAGQKARMQAVLAPGGFRASLANSTACGGTPPPPPSCNDNIVTVSITLDNYPGETTWQVTNSGGTVVASGGPYGGSPNGSTVTSDLCLADGCYDFTIFDSYGDGICCAYGNGSYAVTSNGQTLASGGAFTSSETTNLCLGGGPSPTCDDGVQNGNETGVDCGGPDCPACPTCDDGIQNGNETGVDCGGPDCAACPTCDDGIQNGNETGIDCGGPDCAPCGGGGSEVLLGSFFESGWDGWSDGGSDCARYNGSRSWEGSYSIRLRDNSGVSSSMTSGSYNVSGFNSIEVEFYFYPYSMESGEDFWLRYYDGSSWRTVASYASGTNFNNNTFYVATVTIDASQYNFPTNAQFRFQCDASANADQVYIDAVTITGLNGTARSAGNTIQALETNYSERMADENESDFITYPNPVDQQLTIEADDLIQKVFIQDLTGRMIVSKNVFDQQIVMDVTALESGLYIILLETEEEVLTQKFVKL